MDKIMIILEQQLISYSVGAATTLGRYRRLRHWPLGQTFNYFWQTFNYFWQTFEGLFRVGQNFQPTQSNFL